MGLRRGGGGGPPPPFFFGYGAVSGCPQTLFVGGGGCACDYLEGYKDACEKERSSTDSQRDTHPFVSENERSR